MKKSILSGLGKSNANGVHLERGIVIEVPGYY